MRYYIRLCFYSYGKGDELKSEYPVSWLPGFGKKRLFKIAEEVIYDLRDIPNELLNPQQLRVKTHTLTNTRFFEAEAAAATLAAYPLPLQFLDFETIWTGTLPNVQIPFQFSLHTVNEDKTVSHVDFLDLAGGDPSEEFVISLLRLCGDDPVSIFVYSPMSVRALKDLLRDFRPTVTHCLRSKKESLTCCQW